MEDADQFNIISITAWRGDPTVRNTMEFEVLFEGDAEPIWRKWDRDLSDSALFDAYCKSEPALYPLIFDLQKTYQDAKVALNRTPITEVKVGDVVYVSLRYFSTATYDEVLDIPDKHHKDYVVLMEYVKFLSKHHVRIDGRIEVFKSLFTFDHISVIRWGKQKLFKPNMIVVDEAFIRQHLDILQLIVDTRTHNKLVKYYS
jgi:hypothetical protein